MRKPIFLHKNYTLNEGGYQLKLPLNLETIIPEDDSVRLLSQFVEEMDLTDLYSTYERINSVSPKTLLKIVLYSYMNGDYSSRSMELNCKRDINFMFAALLLILHQFIKNWKNTMNILTISLKDFWLTKKIRIFDQISYAFSPYILISFVILQVINRAC